VKGGEGAGDAVTSSWSLDFDFFLFHSPRVHSVLGAWRRV
jgi:hypothetical protein